MTFGDDKRNNGGRAAEAGVRMNLGRLWRLTRKELRETLRDRRTIVTLLLMPLLVYPLLSLAFRQFLFSSYATPPGGMSGWTIGVASDEEYRDIVGLLRAGDIVLRDQQREVVRARPRSGVQNSGDSALGSLDWRMGIDVEAGLQAGDIDAGLRVKSRRGRANEDPVECEILFRPQSAASVDAAYYLERRLQAVNEFDYQRRLRSVRSGAAPRADYRLAIVESSTAYSFSLSTLVPLILILMTITGAVYPAIDLTAGERERGTLESLIASPVPRFAVLLAKYFAVVTVAVLTALMNITAMTITVHSTGLGPVLFGAHGLSPLSVVAVLGLMVLFAAFFSALLLTLTSFARSFKEAQAYLVPLMLVAMTPGFLSVVPGVTLTGWWAVTPLANIVLLARDVLERGPDPWWAIVALASTLVYGLSSLVLAAHIFGNDAILYGSQDSWDDWIRRPRHKADAPNLPLATLTLAFIFPLQVWISGQLMLRQDVSLQDKLIASGLLTIMLYMSLPAVVAFWRNIAFTPGFQLRGFSVLTLAGSILVGLSFWTVAHEVVIVSQWLGLGTIDAEKMQNAKKFADQLPGIPLSVILFSLGFAPAVGEEFFFRGFLLNALRRSAAKWTSILLCGILFGLFHLIVGGGIVVERLFTSTLTGCVLAWIAYESRSVFPGMAMHATFNGILMTAGHYRERLQYLGFPSSDSLHLPKTWQAAGIIGTAIGCLLIYLGTRQTAETPDEHPTTSRHPAH